MTPRALPEALLMDRDFFCMHSELCKTLANDKRQMILAALRDGELSVGELVDATGIPQANLSQHLAKMRANGVVRSRREGAFTTTGSRIPSSSRRSTSSPK
jgi:ArsR family transcriptional regulator